ncbi:Tetracycline resistance protein, class C [Thalassovita gelatinovora]|uniref:Tetracycline resistance protein, class C n=1 Tax=Thalassovita gelatinovora TaxID=53501 RepID=A0A0P1FV86_THAGE|nr:TCR/Tet family MFS transporter [Thalassovita gelatinovora]QIZ80374.1 TCR/Tet family MFS transporter [Thalassovita gelatinovora]CUH64334.1 Tetracycline resistance protein, class C [Thalassovita gelatinovora]SEQ93147.1 MFS transporter, DHA1 family, tetracycline resistance protein [Thalassovita gelatinovora]
MSIRLPVLFILTTIAIDAIGIGLIMPVMPGLIREVWGGDLSQAAIWGGILATSFAVMQFLFGPLLGRVSDSFGRRPVLLVSLIVMAADYLLMALAGTIWLLLVGRIVGGITAATHSTAMAFMADISAPEDKARRFGMVGAAFGAGFVLGPVLGGLLAEYGTRAPFYLAAVLALGNAVFGALILPETVTDKTRRVFHWTGSNPFSALQNLARLPSIQPLVTVYFFYQLANMVYPAIWAYFTIERFGWSPGMIGISLMAYGTGLAVVQGALVAPTIRILGNQRTVILGLVIELATLIVLTAITSGFWTLILIPVISLGAVGLPALQAIIARSASDDSQGELQGVLASITSVAMIIGPVVMTQIFAAFTTPGGRIYLPGAPFLLAASLMLSALLLFVRYPRQEN